MPYSINIKNAIIQITDMYGRHVKTINKPSNFNSIPISNFASGIYLVKIFDGNKEIMAKKLIKN